MIDKSPFIDLFGDYPMIRVFDFLLANEGEYSKTELARLSNVCFNTLEGFWEKLTDKKIITMTRKVGRVKLYSLNKKNQIVRDIILLDKNLLLQQLQVLEGKISTS